LRSSVPGRLSAMRRKSDAVDGIVLQLLAFNLETAGCGEESIRV